MSYKQLYSGISVTELKEFLDEKADLYNRPSFIQNDPVSIPHRFNYKEDIEISGFLTATIAWGNRTMILRNADLLMEMMECAPYDFIMNFKDRDLAILGKFVHRTFNSSDLLYFMHALRHIYRDRGGLEKIFSTFQTSESLQPAIHELHRVFFELPHETRTEKHVSDPFKGSAAKKINMVLRWMVRKDDKGVDFGIWEAISPSIVSCPLDVHSGNVARRLGILKRKQNDSKAVKELDSVLRTFDKHDPVKYDFALFGLGVSEKL